MSESTDVLEQGRLWIDKHIENQRGNEESWLAKAHSVILNLCYEVESHRIGRERLRAELAEARAEGERVKADLKVSRQRSVFFQNELASAEAEEE